MSLVVLDTDVASASLRDRLPDWLRAALAGHAMCITFVTVGELMKWRVLRSWGLNRTADLARWRQRVGVLEYDEAVAEKWGQLQARAQRRGRPRPHNDTWVAACCLVDDLPLATLNTKDFADFAEHEGLTLIEGDEPWARRSRKGAEILNFATWDHVGIRCVIGHPDDAAYIAALQDHGRELRVKIRYGPYRGNREPGFFDWS